MWSFSWFQPLMCLVASWMQEEELEQQADLAKAEQAAHSETLRDTAPVIDANKVPTSSTRRVRKVNKKPLSKTY